MISAPVDLAMVAPLLRPVSARDRLFWHRASS